MCKSLLSWQKCLNICHWKREVLYDNLNNPLWWESCWVHLYLMFVYTFLFPCTHVNAWPGPQSLNGSYLFCLILSNSSSISTLVSLRPHFHILKCTAMYTLWRELKKKKKLRGMVFGFWLHLSLYFFLSSQCPKLSVWDKNKQNGK